MLQYIEYCPVSIYIFVNKYLSLYKTSKFLNILTNFASTQRVCAVGDNDFNNLNDPFKNGYYWNLLGMAFAKAAFCALRALLASNLEISIISKKIEMGIKIAKYDPDFEYTEKCAKKFTL